MLRNFLLDPRIRTVDVDSPLLIAVHKKILTEKRCMREVFTEFYNLCHGLAQKYFETKGLEIELGAGSSFFKSQFPEIISSDIKPAENLDMIVNAQKMPFRPSEVKALYGINCFHHFPDPKQFFREADRVLSKGGGIVLIEPYFGPLARLFYSKVFTTEHFNKNQLSWQTDSENSGPMQGANQALSYIVLFRDQNVFQKEFSNFEIVYHKPLTNYVRYFFSGGINFRQLAPDFFVPVLRVVELILIPLARLLALHHVVVIKKIR